MLQYIWIIWIIFAIVCLIIDLIKSKEGFSGFCISGLVAAVVGIIGLGDDELMCLLFQAIAFFGLGFIILFFFKLRRKAKKLPRRFDVRRLIGTKVVLQSDASAQKPCRMVVEECSDVDWALVPNKSKRSYRAGDVVRIVKCEGNELRVARLKRYAVYERHMARKARRQARREERAARKAYKKSLVCANCGKSLSGKSKRFLEKHQHNGNLLCKKCYDLLVNVEPAVVVEETKTTSTEVAATETVATETVATETVATEVTKEMPITEETTMENKTFSQIKYNKSFTAKLMLSEKEDKEYYSEIKNYLLALGRGKQHVNARLSWKHETFRIGRELVARLSMRGKTLCLYLPLDAKDFADTKYSVEDVSGSKSTEEAPALYRVNGPRRCKYAKDLVDAVASKLGLTKGEVPSIDYTKEFPKRTLQKLIEKGLVKVDNDAEGK